MPRYSKRDDPLLAMRPYLTKPRWHNLVLLVLALAVARSFVAWRIAVAVILPIRLESAYQRLKRLLGWPDAVWGDLKYAWVRWVLAHFASPGQPLRLLIDWTVHTDRCRSLWVQLVAGGGRSVPLTFWLAALRFGGPGRQRAFEDAALRQLRAWLPHGWPVLLVGDRGFGGRDRMRFVRALGWSFVFRVTGDARIAVAAPGRPVRYERLDARPPAPGRRWQREAVRYGRHRPVVVNVVATCVATAGGPAVWYLVTDRPLTEDVVACYGERMQIEQSFRDYKADLGLEQEYTRQPARRLEGLLVALLLVAGRQLWQGRESLRQTAAPAAEPEAAAPAAAGDRPPRYRVVSDWRRGWHELLTELVLGPGWLRRAVAQAAAKAQRLQQRPQVVQRRKLRPTKNRGRSAA